jgi:hypothetical protein
MATKTTVFDDSAIIVSIQISFILNRPLKRPKLQRFAGTSARTRLMARYRSPTVSPTPHRAFRCDGIAIAEMRMRGKLRNDGKLEVEVKGEFDSVGGHDKRVDMKYELLNGDTIVGVGYSEKLKAPEGKQKRFSFDFDIPAGQLQSQPPTRLRITCSDYDDCVVFLSFREWNVSGGARVK